MALNSLICLVKEAKDVKDFPKSIFQDLMVLTMKIMEGSKYKDLRLMGLYLLKSLVKLGTVVGPDNFSDVAATCFEFVKTRDFKLKVTAAKALTYLFRVGSELSLTSSSVKKHYKKVLLMMNEWMTSELRRNFVEAFHSAFRLAYWIDSNVDPKKRKLSEDTSQQYIGGCILQAKGILASGAKSGEEILLFTIYNCLELLIIVVEETSNWLTESNLEEILESIIEHSLKIKQRNNLYALRDAFCRFFEKIVASISHERSKKLYDWVDKKLSRSKHKITNATHPSFEDLCSKSKAQDLLKFHAEEEFQVIVYLRVWNFLLAQFGDDFEERLTEDIRIMFSFSIYLYSSDAIVQWCAAECYVTISKLSLGALTKCLEFFQKIKRELQNSIIEITAAGSCDHEKLMGQIVRLEGVNNVLYLLILKNKEDLYELATDYTEIILRECLGELSKISPIDFRTLTFSELPELWKFISAYNSWKLLVALLQVGQKWVSLHLKDILACWQNYFMSERFDCSLGLSKGETYIYSFVLLRSIESLESFVVACPLLVSDKIKKYISLVCMGVFKQVCADKKTRDKLDPLMQCNLKATLLRIILNLGLEYMKPIINQVNQLSFADVIENLRYLDKIPSVLLDEDERRLVRISFAELETYMIIIPDSLKSSELLHDNIEFAPFSYCSNKLIISNESEGCIERMSAIQFQMIGAAFNSNLISGNNKIKILQYIESNIKEIARIRGSPQQQNQKAKPFLLALLAIANSTVKSDSESWSNEALFCFMLSCELCFDFIDIQIRILCALCYSKLVMIGDDRIIEKAGQALYQANSDSFKRPTVVMIVGFFFKYLSFTNLQKVLPTITSILIDASRDKENEISSKRFLFITFSIGLKQHSEAFLEIFEQCSPFLQLHYIENANGDKMTYWSICEWMATYITEITAKGKREFSLNLTTLLFDLHRTFFPYSFPVIDFAKLILMKSIYKCPSIASKYRCFAKQEAKILSKLKPRLKKINDFPDFALIELDAVEAFVENMPNLNIAPLDLSFMLLDRLNELNYQPGTPNGLISRIQELYLQLLRTQIDHNAITLEEILHFYKGTLLPGASNVESRFQFSRSVLEQTQAYINSTFEGLLRNIDVGPLSPEEILGFSGLVYPFIFKMASGVSKSHRDHGVPMLLYITKKMVLYNEEGYLLAKKDQEHLSLVQNYSAQLQAILRYNLKEEANNRANIMRKIHELFYYFYKVTYRNDSELFLSQFDLFLIPTLAIPNGSFRSDIYSRIKYLALLLCEGDAELISRITEKQGYPYWASIFKHVIEDSTTLIFSGKLKKARPFIVNRRYELPNYSHCLLESIRAFLKIIQLDQEEGLLEDDDHTLELIKFLSSYLMPSTTSVKKMQMSLEKSSREDCLISFINLKERLTDLVNITNSLSKLTSISFDQLKPLYYLSSKLDPVNGGALILSTINDMIGKIDDLSHHDLIDLINLVLMLPKSCQGVSKTLAVLATSKTQNLGGIYTAILLRIAKDKNAREHLLSVLSVDSEATIEDSSIPQFVNIIKDKPDFIILLAILSRFREDSIPQIISTLGPDTISKSILSSSQALLSSELSLLLTSASVPSLLLALLSLLSYSLQWVGCGDATSTLVLVIIETSISSLPLSSMSDTLPLLLALAEDQRCCPKTIAAALFKICCKENFE